MMFRGENGGYRGAKTLEEYHMVLNRDRELVEYWNDYEVKFFSKNQWVTAFGATIITMIILILLIRIFISNDFFRYFEFGFRQYSFIGFVFIFWLLGLLCKEHRDAKVKKKRSKLELSKTQKIITEMEMLKDKK